MGLLWGWVAYLAWKLKHIGTADIADGAITGVKLAGYADTTYTPVLRGETTAGSHTYATQYGNSFRIGALVFAQFWLELSAKDAAMAGFVAISLPVTARNTTGLSPGASIALHRSLLPAGFVQLGGRVVENSQNLRLFKSDAAAGMTTTVPADVAATSLVIGSVVYLA